MVRDTGMYLHRGCRMHFTSIERFIMCTGIEIISNQGKPYWGRTQDFEQHFEYAGMKIPAGTKIESTYTPFMAEIATMGIARATDVHAHPVILDGINEQGICGGSFYFDHWYRYASDEEIQAQGKVPLRGDELVTWILTHYCSLDEVKQRLNSEVGIVDAPGPMMGRSVPQHSVFQDESGRSIVVEPSSTNGFAIYENKVGVFANAPTFDWHVTNLKMHLERSTHRHYSYDINEPIESIELDEWTSGLMEYLLTISRTHAFCGRHIPSSCPFLSMMIPPSTRCSSC